MPWGCWLEYNDDRMLPEAWNAATEEFSEDWPSTTVHQVQVARITLSVSYNQKDWGAMQEWISCACSTWHSTADSASTAATPPVAEAAVSSMALSNAVNSVGGYTTGTLGAMMHDCVKWGFTGQQAWKKAQEWQTVLELAQPKRQDAHNALSCPLLKFITTQASQRGVIALTTTRITRQQDIISFSQATACRQILWSDGPWTGREIEPAWENYNESQGCKPTATCKECGFKKLCVLTSLIPTEVPPSPPSPPPSWCCFKCVSPEGYVRAQGRRPKPMIMNWGNVSKTCASIPQDKAEHNRRELVAFCQGCWHFADFRHNKGTIAALEMMTKLKIDAHRTASGTQGRLHGALTIQEIAKYVEYCLKPGKAPGTYSAPMSY